jgi:hypothetical protein
MSLIRAVRGAMLVGVLAAWPPSSGTHVYLIGDSTMADKPTPDVNWRGWGSCFLDSSTNKSSFGSRGERQSTSFIDEGR